ncbi:Extracellular calcium-sensing receptor, partial [Varanus komodoensis]
MTKFYQHILAFVFAIDKVNEDPSILPNITLGFHIRESYTDARMTYRTTLDLLFNSNKFVPNYLCGIEKNVVGVIGALSFETSSCMADILGLYKIPQLSYGSFKPMHELNNQYSFYRMVPNEALQYQGLVQLLLHFQWIWIGLMATDDDGGDQFLRTMEPLLLKNRICSNFTLRFQKALHINDAIQEMIQALLHNVEDVMRSKANAIVIHGEAPAITSLEMLLFASTLVQQIFPQYKGRFASARVWITTAQIDFYVNRLVIHSGFDMQMLHGALSFTIPTKEPEGFQEFLQLVHPSWDNEDGFVNDFWEYAFACSSSHVIFRFRGGCAGNERLDILPQSIFELSMTGHSYSVYNAVNAIAHALHNLYSPPPKHRRIASGRRQTSQCVRSWQLHSFIQKISFNNSAGEEIMFNKHGEFKGGFDITNLITFPNQSYVRVKVGRVDHDVPLRKGFTIHEDKIHWHRQLEQRIARRDKNAFLNEQCKEIEENNRIGRSRDLFKKIGDMKATFHAKMGMIKDQNGRDITEAEEIKKRWQDYTEELYKKELNITDNHDGVVTDLEPDILECEVKWALGSLSNNKASGGDRIPDELFKILKDNAVKVLQSICQQIWKTQQWPDDWRRTVYIPIPKKGNAKECSNYCTIALISHASKVMLKILQARLQQYVDRELAEVQAGF